MGGFAVSACRNLVSLGLIICVTLTSAATAREWHDSTGQHSRSGDFVALRDGRVIVRLPDGHQASAPLDKLSAEDQAYVRAADIVRKPLPAPIALASRSVPARTANLQTEALPGVSGEATAPATTSIAPSAEAEREDRTG